jgi:hypothetical protein
VARNKTQSTGERAIEIYNKNAWKAFHLRINRSGLMPHASNVTPESGVKNAISGLDRLQSVNPAQDVIGQIL